VKIPISFRGAFQPDGGFHFLAGLPHCRLTAFAEAGITRNNVGYLMI
jgi:hypothetical protein